MTPVLIPPRADKCTRQYYLSLIVDYLLFQKTYGTPISILETTATVVNFPTRPYLHEKPDKYRLPIDTPLIPFKFPPGTRGG